MKWVFFTLFLINLGYYFIGAFQPALVRNQVAISEPGIETFQLRSEMPIVKKVQRKEVDLDETKPTDVVASVPTVLPDPRKNEILPASDEKTAPVALADASNPTSEAKPDITESGAPVKEPVVDAPEVIATPTPAPIPVPAPNKTEDKGYQRSTLVCYRYGPFFKSQDASQLTISLEKSGVHVDVLQEDGEVPNKYWVYLPEKETYEEAKAEQNWLTQLGVEDIYIMRAAPHYNRISLGVYNDNAMAERRLQSLLKLKVTALLEISYKLGKQFWLVYKTESEDVHVQLGREFQQAFPDAKEKVVPCLQ